MPVGRAVTTLLDGVQRGCPSRKVTLGAATGALDPEIAAPFLTSSSSLTHLPPPAPGNGRASHVD